MNVCLRYLKKSCSLRFEKFYDDVVVAMETRLYVCIFTSSYVVSLNHEGQSSVTMSNHIRGCPLWRVYGEELPG